MGFSVTGRVLNSLGGEGVTDATVSLNNQMKGRSIRRLKEEKKTSLIAKEQHKCSKCRNVAKKCCVNTFCFISIAVPFLSHQQGGWLLPPGEHDSWDLHHPCQQGAHVL